MAEKVLRWADPRYLETPQPSPISEIVRKLETKGRVSVRYDKPLGHTHRGRKILGEFSFDPPTIFIDPESGRGSRFRFTLAHELGHLVLHGHLDLDFAALDEPTRSIRDGWPHFYFGRKRPATDRHWLEWQANAFASGILVPKSTVTQAIATKQMQLGINRRGYIYVDNQPQNRLDYDVLMKHLQSVYQASRTMLRIRLNTLGILSDARDMQAHHIAQHIRSLFREDGEAN